MKESAEQVLALSDEELKARGEHIKQEKWMLLEKHLGEEYGPNIVRELKSLYELFTDRIVVWMANLYDPKIGGWYWSNSARDNDGFLPSIEETYSAMGFIEATGMCELFDNKWENAIPEWLKKKIGDFIYNLQDEDTFFYHPQWPKEYIIENNRQSRITRDIGSAKRVLARLGITPKYTEPPKLDQNDDTPRMLTQFESVDNFSEYIKKLEDDVKAIEDPDRRAYQFYYYGNLFQSTMGYVKSNPEFGKILLDFLAKWQNPNTGMWSDITCYNATNGLHKIACVYNSLGVRMNYIDKMMKTTMDIINFDPVEHPIGAGTDIYNAWSCLPYVYNNLRNCGDGTEEERAMQCDMIKREVFRTAPITIRGSKEQIKNLLRDDGSFSYNTNGSCSTAQGCPIAVRGSCEGDMNGNGIATFALTQHIMMALEAQEYMVPFFTEAERRIFVNILEELNAKAGN